MSDIFKKLAKAFVKSMSLSREEIEKRLYQEELEARKKIYEGTDYTFCLHCNTDFDRKYRVCPTCYRRIEDEENS